MKRISNLRGEKYAMVFYDITVQNSRHIRSTRDDFGRSGSPSRLKSICLPTKFHHEIKFRYENYEIRVLHAGAYFSSFHFKRSN